MIHFLVIKVSVDGTDIYRKETHTGQYTHFSSFEPFPRKTAWVKSLFHCAFMICSNKMYFNNQIEMIKSFMSWNGYPISIRNFLIRKLKTKYENCSTSNSNADSQTGENIAKVWIKIPYLGKRGENIIKSCTSKIQRFLTKPVKFIITYDTKRISFFVSNKDKLPPLSRSNLVYEVLCPGCGKSYIGMTKRCLSVRLKEHATQINNSAIGKHFSDCEHAQYLANLQNQFSLLNDIPLPSSNVPSAIENLVFNNFRILHLTKSTNYNILAFLETLLIKYNSPQLNTGLKASKELQLFT